MFYAVNDEAYIKLTGSVIFSELERLETETVTLIIVMGSRVSYQPLL